jgi:NitT/TauT family transport system substrate-binding protein
MLKKALLSGALLAGMALAACGPQTPESAAQPTEQAAEPEGPLQVALLPILDSLPYYVAEEQGYFEDAGLEVEVVPVASGLERDQLMQAGEIDGMLTELSTVATFNQDEVTVRAVVSARKAYEDAPLFRVLAAPDSGIETPAELAGVPIGIAQNTIIEYITTRLLEAEGLSADEIVGESIPAIPERYQLLMEGQIAAATLPDPLAQSAIEQGAVNVIDDSAHPAFAVSVLGFSEEALTEKPEAVRRFLAAWDQAAGDINADPEAFRGLLLEKVNVPPNVQETYAIPPFPRAEVPDEDQWADVLAWLGDKGLVESDLPYGESVTDEYLP